MEKLLTTLQALINRLNETNSQLTKGETLREYKDDEVMRKVLSRVYDPLMMFHVTPSNYKKFIKNKKKMEKFGLMEVKLYDNLFILLRDLTDRVITGDLAIYTLHTFIQQFKSHQELILLIIDKNLRIRMSVTQINKALPGLIKQFEVVLANKYDEKTAKKLDEGKWYISRKLDGVRYLLAIDKQKRKMTAYSRTGKVFQTEFQQVFNSINIDKIPFSCVLDGELIYNNNGVEDFQTMMKQIKRKDGEINNDKHVSYVVFDMIKMKDFFDLKSEETYKVRYSRLRNLFGRSRKNIKVLSQKNYSEKNFEKMQDMSKRGEWEGLMLRRTDVPYEGKRTNNLLKVKTFHDDEFKVVDIVVGQFRHLSPETGLEAEEEMMTAVVIDYHGTKVGSGFSLQERKDFYEDSSKIIGKIITVQYFEKSKDKDGNMSLRFPTFKFLYEKGRTV